MFKNILRMTPLTTDAANEFFADRIFMSNYQGDVTFVSTLRALLGRRIPDGESLYFSTGSSRWSAETLSGRSVSSALSDICVDLAAARFSLHIHTFCHPDPAANQAWMSLFKSSFTENYGGWYCVEKVTEFFRKVLGVLCFVNPELKSVLILTDKMTMRTHHYLQCGIFAFLPWYFDPESGVSELEMELIGSLREKTPDHYEACIAKFAETYDFKTMRIRKLLAGFETRYEQMQCETIRQQIENCRSQIRSLNERIGEFLQSQCDYENQLLGLETKIAQSGEDSEIMEYFLCNRHLTLERVSGSMMRFVVMDYLSYFDEEMAKTMIDNPQSYIYFPSGRDVSQIIPHDDMKMLMKAVFLDQKIHLRTCAAFEFNIHGNVNPMQQYQFGYECNTYMPNTHIDRYACMGNYVRTINGLLQKHNYIGAIEQSIASCKSLNFADSAVVQEMMKRLYGVSEYHVNTRCFELPDGSVTDPKGAIEYLKKEAESGGEDH